MQKVLVANRGEIAVRVLRTIKKMGLRSVAVYSEADREAPHVRMSDEAVALGDPRPAASYLNQQKIIDAATSTGSDAIHPGYGFLSENASFARRVTEAGITFIGPTPEAIEIMGSKLAAKETVSGYDIPLVPGMDGAVEDAKAALHYASEIGFPVLIKASAGGGGKGMRIVEQASEFAAQMERARSEALNAFGDASVFVEKYIASPKHIEIQVLADNYGNCIHLCERECSIQRRHQKVIEEAPSVVVSAALRAEMGATAVRVAQSCNYVGAGTVEFIMGPDKSYYFLEMNTRLQVEHPVTEMITGIDLVEQQIRIARGEKLALTQDDIGPSGHAIELRVYAEDPANNFLPSIGTLDIYQPPRGEGVRVDDGYLEGMDVPLHYDPLLSKLIVYASDRNAAIRKMQEAISAYRIEGVQNTLDFGRFVMATESFRSGSFDTHFVRDHFTPDRLQADEETAWLASVLAAKLQDAYARKAKLPRMPQHQSWWKRSLEE